MTELQRKILVAYGSETGNAQDIAEDLGRLCQRLYFQVAIEELNAIELSELLQHNMIIFVLSTTGQGDMPHNSLSFWKKLLRKKLPHGCLSQLNYTCFGLGDSTYIKFNWAARKLIKRLEQLGAKMCFECLEADEQFPDGIDGSFVRWADGLRSHLLKEYPHPEGLDPIPDSAILPPRWSLGPAIRALEQSSSTTASLEKLSIKSDQDSQITGDSPPAQELPIPDGWSTTLISNERLTPLTHWQDVRLVSFDIHSRRDGQSLHCDPGDCLTIYPKNFPSDTQKLIDLMGWEDIADLPLDLSRCGPLPRTLFVPSTCTLRDLLLNNVDITAIPRRSFFKSMSYFTTDEYHRERLLEFTMTEYLDEYFDYATRSRRSILEVLDEFTSVKIPAERLLDVFPLIRGRDFSIANGGLQLHHPSLQGHTRVELLVALIKYRTVLRKPREGLCSRYIANLTPGSRLRVTHKPVLTPIHGSKNAERPLVALTTGTGIAPVRSLVNERLLHPSAGPVFIFFGNRNQAADYFFQHEWQALMDQAAKKGQKFGIFTAFSRDQLHKVYIQDIVRREATTLKDVISQNPIFAVCGGSTKMADACKRAVFEPLTSGDEGRQKELMASVTWWQEIW